MYTLINWFLLEIIEHNGNNTKAYKNILNWKRRTERASFVSGKREEERRAIAHNTGMNVIQT